LIDKSFSSGDQLLYAMIKLVGKHIAAKKFSLTVVYINDQKNETAYGEFKRLETLVPLVEYAEIDTSSEMGALLLETLGIQTYPSILLLNQEDEVVGLDVEMREFENKFFELIRNK
ncbi:MAG: hypothetical protein AAGA30_08955, partial [Planctomycetota bacterium]